MSKKSFYKNDNQRCAFINTSNHKRCKYDATGGTNYCERHDKIYAKMPKTRDWEDDDESTFESNACEVIKGIWIGSMDSSQDMEFLDGEKIKSIVNISGMEPNEHTRRAHRKRGIDYYTLSKLDRRGKVIDFIGDEKFALGGFTPLDFFKYMDRGVEIMKRAKQPVVVHCFTEEHQLLTNKGFKFLHEIEQEWNDADLLFAGYDHEKKQILYEKPSQLFINQHKNDELIEMTHNNSAYRWGPNSDVYGRSQKKEREDPSNGMSLIATKEHRMFVKTGLTNETPGSKGIYWRAKWIYPKGQKRRTVHKDYNIILAKDLVTENPRECVKFLGVAREGIVTEKTIFDLPFVAQLGLETMEQMDAFLELYGYWLGDGSMAFETVTFFKKDAVSMAPVKLSDKNWILKRFKILNFEKNIHYEFYTANLQNENKNDHYHFNIIDKKWVHMFRAQYQHKYKSYDKAQYYVEPEDQIMEAENIRSAKWFWWWVWDLDKYDLRKILAGLRFADGNEANNENSIYTSSARFRDEIVRIALHAGYSPHYRLVYEKGAHRGIINGKNVIANHDNWRVSYDTSPQYAEPNLRAKRDIKVVKYTGRTWCVKMPHDFIIVRRAHFDKERGIVTKSSRPLMEKNCHAGINRAASLIASYLMTGTPKKYTYDSAVNLLTRANSKRDYGVLTNRYFRDALKRYPIYKQIKQYGSRSPRIDKNQLRAYQRYISQYMSRKYPTRYQSRTSGGNKSKNLSSSSSSSRSRRGVSSSISKNPRHATGHHVKKSNQSFSTKTKTKPKRKRRNDGKIIIVKKKK